MRVVAIDAVILLSRPLRQIPVTVHSAMNVVFVVAHLRAMALSAQAHDFRELNPAAIGKFQ
jgi:hypothetical protein